jgi:hypothetical protein
VVETGGIISTSRNGQQAEHLAAAGKRVHTTRAGAELNAQVVVSALRSLPEDPTAKFQRPKRAEVW